MIFPIEIKDLSFRYKNKKRNILNGANLKIKKGEVIAIVGLSGNGKSTLCHCISGIIPHVYDGELDGQVLLYGKDIKEMKLPTICTKIGIVFQDPDTQIFSPTVEDEIAFGPENLCIDRDEIGKRIFEALDKVKMKEFRYDNPNNLSGGQKQLIALASVLSLKPQILIFDEVMAQIDKAGKKRIKEIIKELKSEGKTIIMVEHDLNNLDVADRVLALRNGKLEEFKGEL
jgi:energy-coupling factor transport system ATP-binding protein